jgi:hypothetical protein
VVVPAPLLLALQLMWLAPQSQVVAVLRLLQQQRMRYLMCCLQ